MNDERKAQALREASAGWREMGRHIEEAVRGLDREVGHARADHWQGPAAEAFSGDWTRLRKSVDEALPVFELAAADLDRAADHAEQSAGSGGDDAATGEMSAEPVRDVSDSYNVMYALTALSQIGSALGATFGRGRAGGGASRGRSPLARSTPQQASTAPSGADPFGPPDKREAPQDKPTGGLGVARGRRGPARGETQPTPSETDPAEASRREPEPQRTEESSASAAPEPAAEKDAIEAAKAPHPDPRRHGAFG